MSRLDRSADGVTGRRSERSAPRLAGLSPGSLSFVGAWLVGCAIARLTGSAAVLLLLAAALVAMVAAIVSSVLAMRRIRAIALETASTLTAGDTASAALVVDVDRCAGHLVVLDDRRRGNVLGTAAFGVTIRRHVATIPVELSVDHPGVIDRVWVEARTAGTAGLVWLKRTFEVPIEPLHIAPVGTGPLLDRIETVGERDGGTAGIHGQRTGEIDGIRPWREGDGHRELHWPSTLRSSTLIVHDREGAADIDVEVDARNLTSDDAGRLRRTLDDGLHHGRPVTLRTAADETVVVTSTTEAQVWSARIAATAPRPRRQRTPLHRRTVSTGRGSEPDHSCTAASRWLTAAASMIAMSMLLDSLGSPVVTMGLVAIGLALGVLASLGAASRSRLRSIILRTATTVAALVSLAYIGMQLGGLTSLLGALRGPMPDLLILLIVLHGFEVTDRRTQRVHQAAAAVVIAYATGLRVDDRIGWWLAVWGALLTAAVVATARSSQRDRTARSTFVDTVVAPLRVLIARGARGGVSIAAAGAATFGLLAIVPVPDGPASLGLPALSNNAPTADTPGGLAGPDGNPSTGDGTRGSLGQVGGYPGFSETLDTSIRGDLGDQVVMRVRAPEAAFWRGQTFTDFDGRTWRVSDETGRPRRGPRIEIPPTLGDEPRPSSAVEVEEFVQTYYVESDLPNVVFAANRAEKLTFEGTVWTRPDGALRSDVTLTAGSAYTVVSQRAQVTAETLRAQGDISTLFASFTDAASRATLDPFLELPASTTQRTIDLATELNAPGASTYDTIRAYETWLATNTVYDLNAPIPAAGEDAVDDYLFESRRGFCEQIASALTIMLRSQGVPARLATGYIPGTRDRVSGLFEVRASDAHAWVEVWFPDTGWQAFDPTANVPLSGDAESSSVGGEVVDAAVSTISDRAAEGLIVIGLGLLLLGAVRAVAVWRHRRHRGRWGLLQDRFSALADVTTNPAMALQLDDAAATELADLLDRVAFDPAWIDDDVAFAGAQELQNTLERSLARS